MLLGDLDPLLGGLQEAHRVVDVFLRTPTIVASVGEDREVGGPDL